MRFRSTSVLATDQSDFLLQLEEKDAEVFINAVGLISLDTEDLPNEYSKLGVNSAYRLHQMKRKRNSSILIKPVLLRKKFLKRKSYDRSEH